MGANSYGGGSNEGFPLVESGVSDLALGWDTAYSPKAPLMRSNHSG